MNPVKAVRFVARKAAVIANKQRKHRNNVRKAQSRHAAALTRANELARATALKAAGEAVTEAKAELAAAEVVYTAATEVPADKVTSTALSLPLAACEIAKTKLEQAELALSKLQP